MVIRVSPESPQDVSSTVRFLLDGEVVSASDPPPTLTVLDYLREHAHRTGTKEGCAEGDCGACTVALGELTADRGAARYRAINSCIRLLPSIDGRELVTVESLQDPSGALHPVQQAMVDQHGSQCGFCTPGFVMSPFALYLADASPTRERVLEALSGNLCRCTGYRPIIEAGLRMGGYPEPAHWSRNAASAPDRCATLRSLQRTTALEFDGWQSLRSIDRPSIVLRPWASRR
jgi:xanthine dehydrogenase small subunit